jgi:hypothetical protein
MINFEAFDVFGAQEVRHGQLEYMVEQLPDYKYVGVARDDGAEKGEYCPVFYRKKLFKLLDSGTFWLSETPDKPSKGWDGRCCRICTWAYLERKSDKKEVVLVVSTGKKVQLPPVDVQATLAYERDGKIFDVVAGSEFQLNLGKYKVLEVKSENKTAKVVVVDAAGKKRTLEALEQ